MVQVFNNKLQTVVSVASGDNSQRKAFARNVEFYVMRRFFDIFGVSTLASQYTKCFWGQNFVRN